MKTDDTGLRKSEPLGGEAERMVASNILSREEKLFVDFQLLADDKDMLLSHLVELGEALPMLDEKYRKEEFLVQGCQSKVWLVAERKADRIFYVGDSNTSITKGLLALLVEVLSDLGPKEILSAEISFPQKIGLGRFVGTQRSSGFEAMVKHMKRLALTLA